MGLKQSKVIYLFAYPPANWDAPKGLKLPIYKNLKAYIYLTY